MKTLQKALVVGVLAATSGFAAAAPTFSFTEVAGFVGGDVGAPITYSGAVVDPVNGPTATPIYNTMSWAGGTDQSSLNLTTAPAGGLTEGVWTTISTLTHNNVVIPGSGLSWGPQSIAGRFRVVDSDGGSDVTVLDDDDSANPIQITLTETPNLEGSCAPPNPNGSVCDDFFTFTLSGLDDLFFTANDGSEWKASFGIDNLVNAAVIGNNVYTAESETSSLDIVVMLSRVEEVPEPATLGILGLGLVGLSLAKRRKENA